MKKLFTLLCSVLAGTVAFGQTIYLQDFESTTGTALPTGFSQGFATGSDGWKSGTGPGLSSTYFSIPAHTRILGTNDDGCNCDKSADTLKTANIDLSAQTGLVYLSMDYYYYDASYQGAQESAKLYASTNNGASWTLLDNIAGSGSWTTYYKDISTYAGNANFKLMIVYSDAGGWLYGMGVDNIKAYVPTPGVDLAVQASAMGITDPRPGFASMTNYIAGMPTTLAVQVQNQGTVDITSLDLTWNDGTNHVEPITISIPVFQTKVIYASGTHNTAAGANNVTFSIGNINTGATDINTANNTGSASVTGVTPNPDMNYLAEEGTGTWCGWCVRGATYMDYMAAKYPDKFVGVAVHNGDPMVVTEYDAFMGNQISGYPSALANRGATELDPSDLEADFISRVTTAPKVKLSGDAYVDMNTNTLYVDAVGNFTSALSGDNRFMAILAENDLNSTAGGQWNQTNYYAGGGNGPMGGFESLPSSVPSATMHYNFVARALMGDTMGLAGSLPATIPSGSTQSYRFSMPWSSAWNMNNCYVAIVALDASHKVMNVAKVLVKASQTGINDEIARLQVAAYPNPTSGVFTVDLGTSVANEYTITNLMGEQVANVKNAGLTGKQTIDLSKSAAGVYVLTVKGEHGMVTRKITLTK